MPITQENRRLSLVTPLEYDHLMVKRLRASEGISRLFRVELEIVHEETDTTSHAPTAVDPNSLIGQPMSVGVDQLDGTVRYFNGICNSFSQGGRNRSASKYRAEIVPKVWLLTQRHQSRIFQQKSVPDILKKVLEGLNVKWEIQGTFHPRNYCVQYRESDWDFASRLMEDEGIFYFFRHTEDDHQMIVANMPQSHPDCPSKSTLPFIADISATDETWTGSVGSWRTDDRVRTGKYTLWDSKFELPYKKLEADHLSDFNIGGNRNLEHYDYPGEYAKRFDGVDPSGGERPSDVQKIYEDNRRTATIRQEEIDVAYKNIYATSDCCSLVPGFKFTLTAHPNANGSYVIVSTQTEAVQSPAYFTDEEVSNPYTVSLVCIPYGGAPFRPLRQTRKPVIYGSQTAFVVGPSGQEIFTDKYGRVKVQFQWDREGQNDSNSSCWIRVAQGWAGKNWGTFFLPRIGMEVIVSFLEGDPDQPIITGSVYNADSMPPYKLPDEKTKMTIKSHSSQGGAGFNEFRFEDKKGSEQIFIHAEKNQDIRVKNDCMELIKRDRHLITERDQLEKVKRDKHLQVTGDHNEKIGGTMSVDIGGDLQEKVSMKYALDAGIEAHIKGGTNVVIEAGTTLTLKVGGNFININSGGIFIKGTMVMLNSGGAAGSGAGCQPDAPKEPTEADNAEPGSKPAPPQRNPPLPAAKFGPMASLMKRAATSGTPFCDI